MSKGFSGLFRNTSGHKLNTNTLRDKAIHMYYLRRRCKTLGIEISNNHAFRVAFNARLIEAGVDGNERCFVLGHSMQTNERHYSFSDRRKADDVRDKLKRLETQ